MDHFVALACIVSVFWYSLPAYATAPSRVALVLSTLFLPVIGWAWTVRAGYLARRELAAGRATVSAMEAHWQRLCAVEFWREKLTSGTPVEKINAAELLALWGESAQPPDLGPMDFDG